MSYFFDTSAVVKIYHKEESSNEVIDIFNSEAKIFLSELSVIEYHSVVYRKFREKNLEIQELDMILNRFEIDLDQRFECFMFNQEVISNAKDIFKITGGDILARSLDIIQVGFFKYYLNTSDIFLTFDSRQNLVVEELRKRKYFDNSDFSNHF